VKVRGGAQAGSSAGQREAALPAQNGVPAAGTLTYRGQCPRGRRARPWTASPRPARSPPEADIPKADVLATEASVPAAGAHAPEAAEAGVPDSLWPTAPQRWHARSSPAAGAS